MGLSGNIDSHMFGGSMGIYSPDIVLRAQYYYLSFFAMVRTILASHLVIRSKIGFAFAAIRENQAKAGMMSVDIARYKLIAFMISTFMAGFAGALVINLLWEQMGLWGMSIDRLLIPGLILVLEILFLPRGLMPLLNKLIGKVAGTTS